MLRPRPHPRRAVILMVVLVLLTLFAVVGLAFVLYASAQAESSRVYREAIATPRPDVDADTLAGYFLRQLIYDLPDDESGIYSALRGHSLGRSMYGWDDGAANETPFHGTGRLHLPSPFAAAPIGSDTPSVARDDFNLVNYTFFRDDGQLPAGQRFLRDPERPGTRAGPAAPRARYLGGFDAPYTYPDLNNMFLAAVQADGTVLMPSFHRPWLFGSNDPQLNSNWTNAAGKYLLLRPRPIDMGPGFPYPEDEGGDVKNLLGTAGGNDSYWLDLNFPVLQDRNGRKFKPLFAPLIVDLDARVNLNVHGNVRARDANDRPAHASNQGWGPWEVNPGHVFRKPGANGPEWPNLLLAVGPRDRGRYGADGQPGTAGTDAPPLPAGPFYSRTDGDGCRATANGYAVSDLGPALPGAGAPPFSCFPAFPPGYDNGSGGAPLTERRGHPLLGGLGRPAGDDRRFPASALFHLLGDGVNSGQAVAYPPGTLCPRNFDDPRTRRLVTTLSADVDRPGVTPWVNDPAAHPYLLRGGDVAPRGGPMPFPRLPPAPGIGGEFGPDWRAVDAALGRVALDRDLPPYPAPDPASGRITDFAGFLQAQQARTDLARELYDRLRRVTGTADPDAAAAKAAAGTTADQDALRWLAQLAVNVVDFIDSDDYLTPFDWYTGPAGTQVVVGTELPRLVVNEAYAEAVNDPRDRTAKGKARHPYQVNFWVELHNPLFADPALSEGGTARLEMAASATAPAYPVYRLLVSRSPDAGLRDPSRVLGHPSSGRTLLVVSDFTSPQSLPGVDTTVVLPASGAFAGTPGKNEGFCVLGPEEDFPGTDPARPQATLRVADVSRRGLTYRLPLATPLGPALPAHGLLLQRLACPALPPNPAPGAPLNPGLPYNPYVTIDYVDGVPTNDGVTADASGPRKPTPLARRHSYGRNQPYAAHFSQQHAQRPQPALVGQPQHTFFRHNAVEAQPPVQAGPGQTLRVPFDWPAHLDRPPVSPAELLLVSAFKPHELTQQFATFAGGQQHLAPWLDPEARLYRLFEFLRCRSTTAPLLGGPGGRVPGLVNVNTLWDPEVFLAVCDPQPANNFRADDLYLPMGAGPAADNYSDPQSVYWRMMATRTPGLLTGAGPGPDDRPFQSFGAPYTGPGGDQYPSGRNVEDTLLRSFDGSGERRLFEPPPSPPGSPGAHPYLRHQLFNKIFNHLTTRSNVFAVWVTVGFFEVTDDTTRPIKLGAEVGRDRGEHVRRRLFAVVDRSRLSAFSTTAATAVAGPGPASVRPKAMAGTGVAGRPWRIHVGSVLTVDADGDEETVVVTAVSATTFDATFTRPHAAGCTITCPGHPGPRPTFDLWKDSGTVMAYGVLGG